jgi:hypothetical protein
MGQLNIRQKTLFVILGMSSLIAGVVGVVIMLKIVLETSDFIDMISDRFIGFISILVLIGSGVLILRVALRISNQKTDAKR